MSQEMKARLIAMLKSCQEQLRQNAKMLRQTFKIKPSQMR